MKPLALCAAATAALVSSAGPATAWGDEGHKVVALIAWQMMTSAAKVAVNAILANDHDTLTPPDFASRATWADKFRETPRGSTTAPWHYVNLEISRPELARACFGFRRFKGEASS